MTADTAPHEPTPLTDRQRWLALYVLCTGVLMIVLDSTIVNVALPTIQEDLDFSESGLAWVVNAYLIAFGGLLLLAGRLGDLAGRRRIFLVGLVVFTLASLACALSPTQEVLVAARFVQGVGGALTSSVVLGMIVMMFPEPKEQAKAIGVFGFVAAGGGSVGLLAGGILTDAISWHWIFLVNIPIGIATGVMARRLVADDKGLGLKQGADVPGTLLIVSGLMLFVYTILQVEQQGWGSTRTLAGLAVAVVLLTGFLLRQQRTSNPLMPLRLFRSRNVSGANLVMIFTVAGLFTQFFLGALYMTKVLDYSPLQVGLAFLPSTAVVAILSLRTSEKLVSRFGARTVLIPTLVCLTGGLLLFARTPDDGTFLIDILPATMLTGVGAGLAFPPLMQLAMSGATPSDTGLASGLINTTVQVGGAVGLALLATLAADRTSELRADGVIEATALNSGYHLGYVVGAGLVGVALLVAIFVLQTVAGPPAAGGHGDASSPPPVDSEYSVA
ncbi:Multidrug resistance protein Stp [Paraconexibacter sp. AEG42_29]|uniref:Multidrug resistance protein Stp n=1 Tax=Paraconexibacter sp. AEG42_29 TaxID=2997339 RepID=A0AAU7B2P2_9ACTN